MNYKRIELNLPDNLLSELDTLAQQEELDRGELMRQAMHAYISERKRWHLREQMKKGYLEMAHINLQLAIEQAELEAEAEEYLPFAEGS
ncbi:ribbon-helix-helix protein, CopG family [Peptococcaceae bacterium 1198_IL3148]